MQLSSNLEQAFQGHRDDPAHDSKEQAKNKNDKITLSIIMTTIIDDDVQVNGLFLYYSHRNQKKY